MADKLEEVKTICWCGKKAAFNARFDAQGHVVKQVRRSSSARTTSTSACAASTGKRAT